MHRECIIESYFNLIKARCFGCSSSSLVSVTLCIRYYNHTRVSDRSYYFLSLPIDSNPRSRSPGPEEYIPHTKPDHGHIFARNVSARHLRRFARHAGLGDSGCNFEHLRCAGVGLFEERERYPACSPLLAFAFFLFPHLLFSQSFSLYSSSSPSLYQIL